MCLSVQCSCVLVRSISFRWGVIEARYILNKQLLRANELTAVAPRIYRNQICTYFWLPRLRSSQVLFNSNLAVCALKL